jgi:uncharacterized cupredoxin-like copper-binding protein
MLKRFALFVGSAMLIMLLVAACGGSDDEENGGGTGNGSALSVDMTEMKFTPATLTVKANEKVTVNLKNSGTVVHDFTIADVGGKRVHVVVDPGKEGKAEFTPTAAGTLNFVCTQAGHEAAGMKGTITVQ